MIIYIDINNKSGGKIMGKIIVIEKLSEQMYNFTQLTALRIR